MAMCKHEIGWLVIRNVSVFVAPNGGVEFGYQRGKHAKLLARCNNPDCDAVRNIYIGQHFGVGYGKVRTAKSGEI